MSSTEGLIINEVPREDAVAQLTGLLESPQRIASHVVSAGAHSIRYDRQSEIRFGPALYRATVEGPMGCAISSGLQKYPVLAPKSPHQADLGWFAFLEWRGDLNGRGSSAVRVFDLGLGKLVATHILESAGFVGWRGGRSRECIVQLYESNRCSRWFALDARTGRKRLLFRGGYEGHVSADGRYLLVLHTRAEVFVALIAIESGEVLDLKRAVNFQSYVQIVTGLDTVRFDPQATRLTSMLNWAKTDYQIGRVDFEKLITIEVGKVALPEVELASRPTF